MKTIGDVVKEAREKGTAATAAYKAEASGAGKQHVAKFKAVNVDDHGVIIGIGASISVDREEDAVARGALLGLSYDFCASKGREFRANHDAEALLEADLVCSWPGAPVLKSGTILQPGQEVPADDSIVGINIEKGNETHWFVGIRPHDARIVDAARKGEIVGFSWGGMVLKADD
jgi:hypothetical protein